LSEKLLREEHAEWWLEQLNDESLVLETGATNANARATDAYYEQHVVANNNRARKRAKRREEGAKDDGLDEGSSDVNI
jgi:hypothetical protein